MPSPAFIAAASAANRQPVALLAIESIDAIKREVTTQPDWQASPILTNINTITEPGRVFMTTDGAEPYSGAQNAGTLAINAISPVEPKFPDTTDVVLSVETPVVSPGSRMIGCTLTYRISMMGVADVTRFGELVLNCLMIGDSVDFDILGRVDGGLWGVVYSGTVYLSQRSATYSADWSTFVDASFALSALARGAWDFKLKLKKMRGVVVQSGGTGGDYATSTKAAILAYNWQYETRYLPTGSITTAPVDMGIVPSLASRFEVDDIVPPGCSAAYVAWGRDLITDGWTSLGTVVDGATLAAHRYYYFTVALTSSGVDTPYLDELRVVGGNSQYDYFSTHKDVPVQGALPYIAPGGVSSISSKIDLLQQATVGELTIKLFWRQEVGNMIATGYLKNKTISCKIGFIGLAEQDYEPYFVGTWYDYQADPITAIITVKTRNILKKFNRKVPDAAWFLDATGAAFVPPRLYTISGNIMYAMLTLADLLGIPDRYLDRGSFTSLAAGARSGTDWNVYRDITEPMDANELLNQLAISAGVFLVEGADGRLTAQIYDDVSAAAPVATLDAQYHKFNPIDGGQKELFTRQAIYYQLLPGQKGGSASDYAKALVYVNNPAELAWQESATKEWMDTWALSVLAIQKLAQRRDGWFANPLASVKVDNVPPRYWGIKRGQVVAVDNLQMPCPTNQWQGYTSGTRFLVMSDTISDPTSDNLSLSFELMQIGTASFVVDPTFPAYTPFDFFPLISNLTLSERTIVLSGGNIDTLLVVSFARPTDFHYGGAAVWASTDSGPWVYKGYIDYGGPEDVRTIEFSVLDAITVSVAVLTVNTAGQTMLLANAPSASHIIDGNAIITDTGDQMLTDTQERIIYV